MIIHKASLHRCLKNLECEKERKTKKKKKNQRDSKEKKREREKEIDFPMCLEIFLSI